MKSFKMMKTLDVAEAKGSLAEHAHRLREGPVILTEKGRPLMVLVPVEKGADVESVSLSMNPEFVAMIERSRALHKPGTGLSSAEVRRSVGTKGKAHRKAG